MLILWVVGFVLILDLRVAVSRVCPSFYPFENVWQLLKVFMLTGSSLLVILNWIFFAAAFSVIYIRFV